jgi:hypothetical protein
VARGLRTSCRACKGANDMSGTLTRAFLSREQINLIGGQFLGNLIPGRTEQSVWEESAVQNYTHGTRKIICNGGVPRVYYYARINPNITAAMDRGRPMFTSDTGAERGAFLGAQTVGLYMVNWTSVGVFAANYYANGWLLIQGGRALEIKSHPASPVGGTVVPLTLYDPIPETIAAGRIGLLQQNPYVMVRQMQATGVETNVPGCLVGVYNQFAPHAHVGYHVWLQTWGPCAVIATPLTLGNALHEHAIYAGVTATDDQASLGASTDQYLGNLMISNAECTDGENFIIVDLKIRS